MSSLRPVQPLPDTADLIEQFRLRLLAGLAWTSGEANREPLWRRVREQLGALLYSSWRNGELVGERQQDAFFVRCDRATMTQSDVDSGRLVVVVGVAPLKPAEFVEIEISKQVGTKRRPWRIRSGQRA